MYKHILVPVDLNEPEFSTGAIGEAVSRAREGQGEVHLMTVLPGFSSPLVADYFEAGAVDRATESVKTQLKDLAAQRIPADVAHSLSVHEGQPADRILFQARHFQADLIVMTAHHRRPLEEVLLGSNSSRVVERATCSVLILRGEQSEPSS